MSRRKLVAGNWKMNGLTADLGFVPELADMARPADVDVLVCPPATLLAAMAERARGPDVAVGGQDCHAEVSGAHTGDVSAAMLRDAGASYVILGHSERRADHGETSAQVKAKAEAALAAGLVPIVCVGETREEREAGRAEAVVGEQLAGSLPDGPGEGGVVIAYEPVWAIGTGLTAAPEDVAAMHGFIHSRLPQPEATRILYGGSVKPDNAATLLHLPDVDGALVGGASLKAADFGRIVAAAGGE